MRVAAIDIGTNTVLLLIADRGPHGELVAVAERATVTRLGQNVDKTRRLAPEAVDESVIARYLYTADLPELDLMIRTSGEMRISNFLLWQTAYAELHVTPVLWPDFRKEHLTAALEDYESRDRRFGGLSSKA